MRRWVAGAAGFLTTNDLVPPTAAAVFNTVHAVVRTYRHWHLQQVLWPAAVYLRQHPQVARRVFVVRLLPGGRVQFELLGGLSPAAVTPAFDGLDLKLAWRLGVQGAGYGCVGDTVLLLRGDFRRMRQGVYGLCKALLQQTPLVLRCMYGVLGSPAATRRVGYYPTGGVMDLYVLLEQSQSAKAGYGYAVAVYVTAADAERACETLQQSWAECWVCPVEPWALTVDDAVRLVGLLYQTLDNHHDRLRFLDVLASYVGTT